MLLQILLLDAEICDCVAEARNPLLPTGVAEAVATTFELGERISCT